MKFTLKNTVALLLSLVFIVSLCCACGTGTDNGGAAGSNTPATSAGDVTTNSGNTDTPSAPENNTEPPTQGKAVNIVSQEFTLTDGFIVPVERQTTVPDGYIGISTAEEFDKIRLNKSGQYILMSDIDLSIISEYDTTLLESGALDGNGFKVSGAKIEIFSLKEGARVVNLGAELDGYALVLAAEKSIIDNCYSKGYATGITCAGIARNTKNSTIANCYNEAIIEVLEGTSFGSTSRGGGIIEKAESGTVINNCYNAGDITSEKGYVGGIAGECSVTTGEPVWSGTVSIMNCYNKGSVKNLFDGKDDNAAGGIYGYSRQEIRIIVDSCYNTGDIESVSGAAAGIGGYNGLISNCYNTGKIKGKSGAYGIIYPWIRGNSEPDSTKQVNVTYCFSIGQISAEEAFSAIAYWKNIDYCYYLDNVSDATPDGALFANVKKLTAEQLKESSSFTGFDFENVWEMGGSDYPYPVFKPQY